ncbi:MAG: phosphate signaling complex protein PhoU [Pirellulales bacterium]|nr:phosphate signaling complex protein PhoU [Pirellulales bacterium]
MSAHLQREIDLLKKSLLSLCALVEDQVQRAVHAVLERDEALAREVEERDKEIDRREVEVEEECLRVLALHQPVATDLRLIVSALKITNDLERIGDMAVNVARKVHGLIGEPLAELNFDLAGMGQKTQAMLRKSIDALVNADAALAEKVCAEDDEVDTLKHAARAEFEERIRQHPDKVKSYLKLMAVVRNLERIADQATNIAEDVVYLAQGRIIRHGEMG